MRCRRGPGTCVAVLRLIIPLYVVPVHTFLISEHAYHIPGIDPSTGLGCSVSIFSCLSAIITRGLLTTDNNSAVRL